MLSKRKIIWGAAVLGAALLFAGGLFLGKHYSDAKYQAEITAIRNEKGQLTEKLNTMEQKANASQTVSAEAAQEILFDEYPKNSKLVSIEYPFSDCNRFSYYQKIDDWQIPFTEKAFTVKWNGLITAGIDMREVSITTNEAGDKLIVNIPTAKIISYTIDKDSLELLDEQNNLFNPISMDDLPKLDADIEEQMKSRAIRNTLLSNAEYNVKLMILDVLRSDPSIGSYYEIEFNVQ